MAFSVGTVENLGVIEISCVPQVPLFIGRDAGDCRKSYSTFERFSARIQSPRGRRGAR